MVEIKNLRFAYGENVIFNGLTVTLPERGVVAVTGESGSGKTTLLNVIAGLIKCEGVTVTGRVVSASRERILRSRPLSGASSGDEGNAKRPAAEEEAGDSRALPAAAREQDFRKSRRFIEDSGLAECKNKQLLREEVQKKRKLF